MMRLLRPCRWDQIGVFSGILLAAALWLLPNSLSAENNPESAFQSFVTQGRQAEERFRYREALDGYQKALALDPHNTQVLQAVARQLIGLERLDEARQIFDRILEIDPKNVDSLILLGVFLQKIKDDLPSAETYYRKALAIDPGAPRANQLLGDLYLLQQRYGEAQTVFESLVQKQPKSVKGYLGLGSALLKQSRFEDAVSRLEQALRLDPAEPESYRLLGQALARLGKRDESLQRLKTYQQVKKNFETLATLRRNVRHNPANGGNWFALGYECVKQKRMEEAIFAFRHGLESDAGNVRVHGLLGALYLQKKQVEEALPHLQTAAQGDPTNPDHFNNLGVCYMMRNNYAEAVRALETSIKLGASNPNVIENLNVAKKKMQQAGGVPFR